MRTIDSGRLSSHCSNDVKLKILFFLIGPPNVAPYIFSSVPRSAVVSCPGVDYDRRIAHASSGSDRGSSSTPTRGTSFVPDFMFRLMTPPRLWPFSASTLFFEIVISSTASTAGV